MSADPQAARWWHRLDDGRIQCDLCPRDCRLHEGQRGLCFVRQRVGDAMVLATYGRSSGLCIDPIETMSRLKKRASVQSRTTRTFLLNVGIRLMW